MQYDRELVLNILERVYNSIEQIEKRSDNYHCGDDFLMTPTGVTVGEAICMQFRAIGESLKGLDKITNKNRKDKEKGRKTCVLLP